jgi:predicted PurR-regulated permease PerM
VLLTLTTSQELWQIWAVLGTIAFVQFLDNNILMPRIVGSKVRINALVSIVGIVLGGALADISGMILSIPVMAVLKIIFDKSRHMRQWGLLLGDTRPEPALGEHLTQVRQELERRHDEEVDKQLRDE